ncbi:MAG: NAD(P)-dependent oxidoreductase [Ilumatobacteraceae bacterium]
MSDALPVLFFDRPLPDEFRDLVDGRAVAVGPDDADLPLADAVVAGMRRWDAAAMAGGSRLRVISRVGVGYDTVDVEAATAAGITVCYAPAAPTVSTAEHTVALMLSVTKGLAASQARAAEGLTGGPATGLELDGRVLGLVGYGRIARRVATVGAALGMDVVAFDPLLTESDGVARPVSLDELWSVSDVVSLHAPALPSTRHVVNAETLATMQPGSYLVNCARGALVDHDALLDALDRGQLAGAGLDVTDPEPLPVGHPLLSHPGVVVTPHVASGTRIGRRRLYQHAIEHALATLAGTPTSVVPEQC